jgi:PAS domain-containing protein
MRLIATIDLIAMAAFGTAVAMSVLAIVRSPRDPSRRARWFFTAAVGLYAIVSLSNVLEHLDVTQALDPIEDYLEILFVPLILYVAHTWRTDQDRRRLEGAYAMLEGQHHLLETVIDASPTALVVTDLDGRVTFSNENARELLELEEPNAAMGLVSPAWRLFDLRFDPPHMSSPGMFALQAQSLEIEVDIPASLVWPDGRKNHLRVNAAPMSGTGTVAGYVYAFTSVDEEPPDPRA